MVRFLSLGLCSVLSIGAFTAQPASAMIVLPSFRLATPTPTASPRHLTINAALLIQIHLQYADATRFARPGTNGKLGALIGLLFDSFTRGISTDGMAETRRIFPEATEEQFAVLRATALAGLIDKIKAALDKKGESLGSQDKMGNLAIQNLMSQYNQAQSLMSSNLEKNHDSANAVIQKI